MRKVQVWTCAVCVSVPAATSGVIQWQSGKGGWVKRESSQTAGVIVNQGQSNAALLPGLRTHRTNHKRLCCWQSLELQSQGLPLQAYWSLITARDDLSAHAQQSAVKRSRGWVDSLSGERNEDFENRILLGQERLPVTEPALGKKQSTWYNNSFKRLARSLSLAASSTKQFLFLLSFSENRLLCSYKIITHKKKRCLITGRTGWFLLYSFSFTVYISLNEPFCVCASLL